jgi:hypothetical protein
MAEPVERRSNRSRKSIVHFDELIAQSSVIAGEPEGSWLAGGQQEGLQYSGGSV